MTASEVAMRLTDAQRTRDDTQGAQAEAEKYLKEPYRRERKS